MGEEVSGLLTAVRGAPESAAPLPGLMDTGGADQAVPTDAAGGHGLSQPWSGAISCL